MRVAERIVHETVPQTRKRIRKGRTIGFLTLMETEILKEKHFPLLGAARGILGFRTHTILHKADGTSKKCREAFGHCALRECGIAFPFGTSQVREYEHRFRAAITQGAECRETGAHSEIIGHDSFLQRNVEARAKKHALPCNLKGVERTQHQAS